MSGTLGLVSKPESKCQELSVSSRWTRLNQRNSHSRLEIEKTTLADLWCVSEGLLKVCVWQIQDSGFLESGVPSWLVEDPHSFVSFTVRSLVHNVLWMGPTYKYWSRLFWGVLSKKYCAMITEKNTLMILFIIALSSNVGPVWILWIILPLSTICGQKLRPICSVAKFDSPEPILCRVYGRRRNFEKSATDNNLNI